MTSRAPVRSEGSEEEESNSPDGMWCQENSLFSDAGHKGTVMYGSDGLALEGPVP